VTPPGGPSIVALAHQALEREADDDDRALSADQLASVPSVSGAGVGSAG